jgi:hypothetical protein
MAWTMEVIRSSSVRPGARVQPLKVSVSSLLLGAGQQQTIRIGTVKFNAVLEGAILGALVLRLPAGAALRGGVVPVEAAICCGREGKEDGEGQKRCSSFHNHLSACEDWA